MSDPISDGAAILSPTSRPIVEATLPVLGAHLPEISEVFYRRLFAAVPALGTDLFNRANQHSRSQQQALASAVAAFAALLVTDESTDVDAVMARIAAKHASLGVQAAHYELVRTQLFAAIAEVPGDAVTPAAAAAWDEVYTLMANSLVEQEARLYDRAGVPAGQVWRTVVVAAREYDGAHAATLFLQPLDGEQLPAYLPGQYISVRVPLGDGTEQIRKYTVTRGRRPGEWALSVKRVSHGYVSPILVDRVGPGERLVVSHPFGSLVIGGGRGPLLLVAAGIGITNTIAALQYLLTHDPERQVTVLQVEHSPYEHVRRVEFSDLVRMLPGAQLHTRYTEFDGVHDDGRNPSSASPCHRTRRPMCADRWTSCVPSATSSSPAVYRLRRCISRPSPPAPGSASNASTNPCPDFPATTTRARAGGTGGGGEDRRDRGAQGRGDSGGAWPTVQGG
ncbi:globin domain-containing protein [Rhodococcus aetherivorans]|uniref:globin domain-containing protein n=1 Tax=Rhodococcus aetherivorans TaxID=191292 RepID=UPI00289DCFD4|nr:globin domain-containing protein [Rhodococcus aetherivorans]